MPAEEPTSDQPKAPHMTIQHAAELLWRSIDGSATADDAADLMIPPPPVDLRHVHRDEWREHVFREVCIPPALVAFVEGQTTFTREEIEGLEDRIAGYYGVTEPYYITAETTPIFHAWLGMDKTP